MNSTKESFLPRSGGEAQESMFPVVILAGGLATRLRPVTETIPKAMLAINNEPFIVHQLRLLKKNNIRKVVLCVGYLSEQIEAFVGDGKSFGLEVSYVADGPTLLGTGGAIKQALHHLGEAFFVLYGDSYLPCDFSAVQAAFQASNKQGLMTVFHNAGRWDTSNVEYLEGQIINYDKKNRNERMHYIDYGLGILTQLAFTNVPANQPFDLATLYQQLVSAQELAAFEVKERFYESGSFTGIEELEYYLSQQQVGQEITA